jgi:hypothetical protein
MNTIQPTSIGEQLKAYIQEIKDEKQEILNQYKKDLVALESEKNEKIKRIDAKWNDIRKEFASVDSEKLPKRKNMRMSDSDISEKLLYIFRGSSTSMKREDLMKAAVSMQTEDVYTKIGIQRPRFNKYIKSGGCIIKSRTIGKTYYWSLDFAL